MKNKVLKLSLTFVVATLSFFLGFATLFVSKPVSAENSVTVVSTEAELATSLSSGGLVKLSDDIGVTTSIVVPSGTTVTLDLNGYDIVGNPSEPAAYSVITNRGNLTIQGNGTILCEHDLAGSTAYAVNTIVNSGKLVIDGATIKNVSTASNQIGYAIDNNSTSYDSTVEILSGEIVATGSNYYDGIRLYANSGVKENAVFVKGGTISSIWMQNPSDGNGVNNNKEQKASVLIEGGKVDALYLEPSANFEASITGGEIGNVSYFTPAGNDRDLKGFIYGGSFANGVDLSFINENAEFIIKENGFIAVGDDVQNETASAFAKVGNVYYESLQEAFNCVVGVKAEVVILQETNQTINILQDEGTQLTINGNGNVFRGIINIDGESRSANRDNEYITIKNFEFVTNEANHTFINGQITNHYPHNITVEDCSFVGTYSSDTVGMRFKSTYGLTIKNVTAEGMHSLAQNTSGYDVLVENVTLTQSKSGISLGTVQGTKIVNSTFDTIGEDGYGVRVNGYFASTTYIENLNVKAFIPVLVRNVNEGEGKHEVVIEGTNNLTATNSDGYVVAISAKDYDLDNALEVPNKPTTLIVNDADLNIEKIFGARAKIGEKYYASIQLAIDSLTSGDVEIVVAQDTNENITIPQVEGLNITLNGNGTTYSGTITTKSNARANGAETLVIKNFNFVTSKASHYFFDANSTDSALRYPHNITIKDSTFTATGAGEYNAVAIRIRQGFNIAIENVEVNGMHSALQGYGITKVVVDGITINGCKNGISAGTSSNVTINNAEINVSGYGVRADGDSASDTVITNSNIQANLPVIVRKVTKGYALSVKDTNLTANSADGYGIILTAGDDDDTFVAPSVVAQVVSSNVTGSEAIFGVNTKIGDVYYTDLQDAINNAQENAVIEILKDIELAEALNVSAGKKITLNLNGNTISRVVTETVTKNNALLNNNGDLTIVGGGSLVYEYTGATKWLSLSTISNTDTLVLEGVNVINKTTVACYSFAIDSLTGSKDVNLVVKNSNVISNYRSIRQFANSVNYENNLTISGESTLVGQVWLQSPNSLQNKASITIESGSFAPAGNDTSSVFITTASSTAINASVTSGVFATKIGVDNFNNLSNFISGGTFGMEIPEALWKPGYVIIPQNGVYVAMDMPTFSLVVADYLGDIADQLMSEKVYSEVGANTFENIIVSCKNEIANFTYISEVKKIVNSVLELFDKVLTEIEAQELAIEYMFKVKEYAELKKVDFNDQRVIDACSYILDCGLKVEMQMVLANIYDVIDVIAEENALALKNAKDSAILELIGANGENEKNVTSSMLTSIYVASTIEDVETALNIAKIELQEIILYKGYIKNASDKATENAIALQNLSGAFTNFAEKTGLSLQNVLDNIATAIEKIGEVKTDAEKLLETAVNKNDLKVQLDTIEGKVGSIVGEVSEYIKTNVSDKLEQYVISTNNALDSLTTAVNGLGGTVDSSLDGKLKEIKDAITAIKPLTKENVQEVLDDNNLNLLDKKVSDLANKVEEDNNLIKESLKNISDVLAQHVTDTKTQLKDINQAVDNLTGTLGNKVDAVKSIVEKINPLTKEQVEEILSNGLEDLDDKVGGLITKVEADNKLIKEALTGIQNAISGYVTSTNTAIAHLTTAVNAISGTVDSSLDSKLQEIKGAITAIKPLTPAEVESILANSQALNDKVTIITNRIAKMDQTVANVVNDIAALITNYKIEVDKVITKVNNIVTNLEGLSGTITSLKGVVEDAQDAAELAQQTANTASQALADLSDKITQNTTSIEDLANVTTQALQAAQRAEEAARLAMERAQTAEVKSHATLTEQELKDWLDEYLDAIGSDMPNAQARVNNGITIYSSITQIGGNYRNELIEKLEGKYTEENAALVLSYYDVAIAQISAAVSKEEINLALENFKANVAMVEYLSTLTPAPAYNDRTLVSLLIVVAIVEAIIAVVAIILLIKVTKTKGQGKKGPRGPKGGNTSQEKSIAEFVGFFREETKEPEQTEEEIIEVSATEETFETETGEETEVNEEVEETEVITEEPELTEAPEKEESNLFAGIQGVQKTFEEKLQDAEDVVKEGYKAITEELLSYKKVNPRLSKKALSFRNGRKLIAKMTIVGKTLRVYLALDPNSYDVAKMFHKDVSDKKAYEEVPMLMRVKSARGAKRTVQLVKDLAEKLELVKRPANAVIDARFAFLHKNDFTFEDRLSMADLVIKQGYETIKEELLKYKKVNARISKKAISFRNGRKLIAKMTIVGKTLRVYLALDPNVYEFSRFFQRDVSSKKAYEEVPMLMRVKSGRAINRTVKLIPDVAEKFGLVLKPEPKQ